MPVYEYQCSACGQVFEAMQKFSDPPLNQCKSCGAGPVTKLISQAAFALKGGGWYQQGYGGEKPAPCSAASGDNPGCASCPKAANE